jgi:hypothetical protein
MNGMKNKMDIEKLKQHTREGKYILLTNKSSEEYKDELEQNLEDFNNNLEGANGDIPERVIELLTNDGVLIKLEGNNDILESGWGNNRSKRMSALELINIIQPEHTRTSCDDDNLYNGFNSSEKHTRCLRCTLLQVLKEGKLPKSHYLSADFSIDKSRENGDDE